MTKTIAAAFKQDLAACEARLLWKVGAVIVVALVSLSGIFAVIVGWLVRP